MAEALSFYDQHYDIIVRHFLKPQKKEAPLEAQQDQACRFCGKRSPDVSFKLEAHAIPEALGNKTLFSAYECDACNELFGHGIENDLGNWSKPARTLTRIRGKKGVPTLKKGSSGGWRIQAGPVGLEITAYEDDPIVTVDEAAKKVTFRLRRDPYTPVAVLKAFAKIGLTILPEEEIRHFGHALQWIRETDHAKLRWKFPIFYTFQPGPLPNDLLVAFILRRKPDAENVPYAFLVLSYGNEVFQIMIPTPERDRALPQAQITLVQFPVVSDLAYKAADTPSRADIDLCGHQIIKGETVHFTMAFEALPIVGYLGAGRLPKARDVGLKVLTGAGASIDTTKPEGRLFFAMLGRKAQARENVR